MYIRNKKKIFRTISARIVALVEIGDQNAYDFIIHFILYGLHGS